MSLRGFIKSVIIFSLTFVLPQIHEVCAQVFSDAKIKSAYIVQFSENIEWPNEVARDSFILGVFGSAQDIYDEFVELSKIRKLKKKPISVRVYTSIDDIKEPYPNILYVNNLLDSYLPEIIDKLYLKPTLVVSDESEHNELVMINFIYTDSRKRISFELNSHAIEHRHNLKILPPLLLLGGTKLEVAELYLRQEEALRSERERVERYRTEISQQQEIINIQSIEIKKQQDSIIAQQESILKQQQSIDIQKNELDSLMKEVRNQKTVLNENLLILKKHQDDIRYQQEQIALQSDEIETRENVLEVQSIEIRNQQERIASQRDVLDDLEQKIQTQRSLLYISLIAIFLAVGMISLVYIGYRNKKKANKLLEEKNRAIEAKNVEIEKQKEELQTQAAVLSELYKELDNLAIIVNQTDNAVAIFRPDGILQWINPGFTKVTGYNFNELKALKGKTIFEITSFEAIDTIFAKCIDNKDSVLYETTFETNEGKTIWLQTTLTPILDSNNEVTKVVSIDSDITELKRAHEETIAMIDEIVAKSELIQTQNEKITAQRENLEKTLKQLYQSEKMASIGVLTAGIAHEINNPINFVYAGANSLMRDFLDIDQVLQLVKNVEKAGLKPEEIINKIIEKKKEFEFDDAYSAIEQTLNDINVGAQRVAEIVQGLSNFSRSDTEKYSQIDIHKIISSALVLLRNKYKDNIEIVKNFDESLPSIECKVGKMNQVFMNIISNAIDAIEGKGEIRISTSVTDDICKVSIKDNGKGIPNDIMPKIFDPFYTTKEVGSGTGLGLSISYGIIEEHNGKIDVVSDEGDGSEFIITLPLRQEKLKE